VSESKDLFYEAKSFYQEKNYERALKLYKNLSRSHPNDYRVWNNLGLCHTRLNDYKKAIVAFEKAVEVNAKKELIWSNLGKAYYHNGEFTKIIKTYKRALKVFPYNTFYLNGIGTISIELNSYDYAIKIFKYTLDIDQQNHTAWHNLCLVYGKKGVDFSSTEFKPNSEVSWHQLSKALLVSSLFEDSLHAINRALSINPSFHAAIILRIKITLIIKENEKIKSTKSEIKTDLNKEIEKDTYYERFKKLQEKRKKRLDEFEDKKGLTIEERFKKQQAKFKKRSMHIDDTLDFEPSKAVKTQLPKIEKPQKPLKQYLTDKKLICIDGKYHKIDECNFVIDGANVARESISDKKGGKISRLYKLFEKLNSFGITKYVILCDRSLYYTIDNKKEYKLLIKNGRIFETPGGTEADHFILNYAKENNSFIISNDRFREFKKFFGSAWLNKRLITFKTIKDTLYFDKIYTAD
jgi:tetratricopeptide (TPR) repeat protein